MNDWLDRLRLAAVSTAIIAIMISLVPASGADLLPAPPSAVYPAPAPPMLAPAANFYDPYRTEARFGVFAHGVGGIEKGSLDLNPELVFPRLPFGQTEWWSVFVPRPHLGALINLGGRTSAYYAGALWSFPLPHRFFAELFVDGAGHNGSLDGSVPGHAALGCPVLFNVGGSVGYSFDPHWSVMLTFDHLSNGKHVFGTRCEGAGSNTPNPGLNDYGARVGYAF